MSPIRALEPEDIPRIVALRRSIFSHSAQASDSALTAYYRMLFFENPWQDPQYPSLVHVEDNGDIRGFIGSIPRPMVLGTERLTAVTTTELMVAPDARGFVGPALFRRMVAGSQDITYSDRSNHQARTLYESIGGATAVWSSLYWTLPLDGRRLSFDRATGGSPSIATRALRRVGNALDTLASRFVRRPSQRFPTRDEPLRAETVIENLRRVVGPTTMAPEYDARSFAWLLDRVTEGGSRVVAAQVMHESDLVGWFIYVVHSGEAEVVQLAALSGRHEMVLEHLIHRATSDGVGVLKGRVDRQFAKALSDRGVPLTLGHPWTVVHARRQDILTQFLSGSTFFSRLEAEWWINT